jgi:hypothetical protein
VASQSGVDTAANYADFSNKPRDVCVSKDPASGGCLECYPGLRGPTCGLCETKEGCSVLVPTLKNPICDRNATYSKDTKVKTYSCDATDIAGGVVAPGLAMRCNKSSITNSAPISLNPDGSGPFVDVAQLAKQFANEPFANGGTCDLQFKVKSDMDKPVMCLAYGCLFQDGKGQAQCQKVKCDCPNPKGCPTAIAVVLPQLTEKASIVCNPNDPRNPDELTVYCAIEMDGLPLTLEAPCNAGECMDPTYNGTASGDNVFVTDTTKSWTFAVASIPLAAAIGLGLLLVLITVPRMVAVLRGVSAVKTQGKVESIASRDAWRVGEGVWPLNGLLKHVGLHSGGCLVRRLQVAAPRFCSALPCMCLDLNLLVQACLVSEKPYACCMGFTFLRGIVMQCYSPVFSSSGTSHSRLLIPPSCPSVYQRWFQKAVAEIANLRPPLVAQLVKQVRRPVWELPWKRAGCRR